jgi:hypothetical protein
MVVHQNRMYCILYIYKMCCDKDASNSDNNNITRCILVTLEVTDIVQCEQQDRHRADRDWSLVIQHPSARQRPNPASVLVPRGSG